MKWTVVQTMVDPGSFLRAVIRCPKGSTISFFSYGVGDDVQGVGLSGGVQATDVETNLAERYSTNNEDFAIEGIAATCRGHRIAYTAQTPFTLFGTDTGLSYQILRGDQPWYDAGSLFLPPEVGSPLTLQDGLYERLKPFIDLQIFFDRKAGDHICSLDRVPEGGARSYLNASGEPSVHNFFRIPDGYTWNKSSQPIDRLLNIEAIVKQDVWATITCPLLWHPTVSPMPVGDIGAPTFLWTEIKLVLVGRAFYNPSQNV